MAEGEHKHRNKENIHFWDKRYSSGGAQQDLPQAAPAHCSATALRWRHPQQLHGQTLASAAGHGVPGRAWGPDWLSIAASVPALIDRAGRAGPCYDCLCFQGWWQMAGPGAPGMFAVGRHGPCPARAWQLDEEGAS